MITEIIHLTDAEVLSAIQVGGLRQWESLKKNLPDKHGFLGDGWEAHIEGAMGEIAAAKALNCYWCGGINTFKTPDLYNIQVRTRSKKEYELLLRDNDDSCSQWVLVTGKAGKYQVHGWIWGYEGKNPEWRKEHGGRPTAYFVPHSQLHPLHTLLHSTPTPHQPHPRRNTFPSSQNSNYNSVGPNTRNPLGSP